MSGPILVVGAAGRLGAAMVDVFSDRRVIAYTRASLDITDPIAVRTVVTGASPAVVINCAAFNLVDAAQQRPGEAIAVNALAVRSLAQAANDAGAVFVHYSTDFVFDGAATTPYGEESAPAPQSTYAQTKLLGEWFALDATRGFALRVESLFGSAAGWSGRPGSLDQIIDAMGHGRTVKAFVDRVVSPSYVPDVARATRHLIDSRAQPGLYHCVNSGHATWHAIAEAIARLLDVEPHIERTTMDAQGLAAPRPKYCALDNRKLAAAGFPMPSWEDAVSRCIAARRQASGTIQ